MALTGQSRAEAEEFAKDKERTRKLLVQNPDKAALHFHRRVQKFFAIVICGKGQPLGDILDHWWRYEFQMRGSPHVHMLLWAKDVPRLETDEGVRTRSSVLCSLVLS